MSRWECRAQPATILGHKVNVTLRAAQQPASHVPSLVTDDQSGVILLPRIAELFRFVFEREIRSTYLFLTAPTRSTYTRVRTAHPEPNQVRGETDLASRVTSGQRPATAHASVCACRVPFLLPPNPHPSRASLALHQACHRRIERGRACNHTTLSTCTYLPVLALRKTLGLGSVQQLGRALSWYNTECCIPRYCTARMSSCSLRPVVDQGTLHITSQLPHFRSTRFSHAQRAFQDARPKSRLTSVSRSLPSNLPQHSSYVHCPAAYTPLPD